jgi:hypothetical protein
MSAGRAKEAEPYVPLRDARAVREEDNLQTG